MSRPTFANNASTQTWLDSTLVILKQIKIDVATARERGANLGQIWTATKAVLDEINATAVKKTK